MLMSADSSDSHPSSSSSSSSTTTTTATEAATTSSSSSTSNRNSTPAHKTSVICLSSTPTLTHQPTATAPPAIAVASSTTPNTAQLVVGRSHLENALKLPPNTSVSTYYQHTKVITNTDTNTSTISEQSMLSSTMTTTTTNHVVFQAPADYRATAAAATTTTNRLIGYHNNTNNNNHNINTINSVGSVHPSSVSTTPPVTDMDTVPPTGGAVITAPLGTATSTIVVAATAAARKMPHSNVIFMNNKSINGNGSSATTTTNNSATSSTTSCASNAPNSPTSTSTSNAIARTGAIYQQHQQQQQHNHHSSVVSTTDLNTAYDSYHHSHHSSVYAIPNGAQTQPLLHHAGAMVPYHHSQALIPAGHHAHQQQQHHVHGNGQIVVVGPADSRPQTPDYIKSYPVMDTTVASSVKGEPELHIEFDGTTVLCRVCGDKASGFHYGVHSCEGCKGFFRRSIQQKIQYRPCTKNQQCSILRINRNRCQYCRLKKCIAVGMSRDAVRFGRVPKREKARILAAMQQSTQNRGQQRALATELDDQPRLLAAVLRAHLETCEFTKEKVAAMRQRARECPSYSMPTLLACPLNPAPELQSEQEFSQRFAHVIRGVIDFAGMIPGFQLLTQDDKFTLLKAGLFDALFVRLICMFDSSINSIICLNGQVMRRDAIQNGANARFLVDSTFNFAERMNSMNLSDAEIGLFCAIVLITPDRPGLRNIELIEKMYSRLKGCLQSIVAQNRPDQPEFLAKLLDTMPDLRTLSTLHTEKLVVFRTEHKELLRQQMWTMDDDQHVSAKSPGSSSWDDARMDVEAKSPLGSVSSTESGDLDYTTSSTTNSSNSSSSNGSNSIAAHLSHPNMHHQQQQQQQHHQQQQQSQHHSHQMNSHAVVAAHTAHMVQQQQQHHAPSAIVSSAPLLAATLSGGCPLRNRANSGSSGDSSADLDMVVGSHAHLTQNGLTITPIVRNAHAHPQLHHHLTAGAAHRYRKLDSPTDSGIESGNEKNECGSKNVSSGGSSSCSSPRSSVDDALDCSDAGAVASVSNGSSNQVSVSVSPVRSPQPCTTSSTTSSTLKRQIVEDMPVLKRVLQAPPLYDTNSLMDEAYKPHKKFRALRHREYETAEADASASSTTAQAAASTTTATTTTSMPAGSPQNVHAASNSPPPSLGAAAAAGAELATLVVPQASVSPSAQAISPAPTVATQQQPQHLSQLHMHLTRPASTNHLQQQLQAASASSLSSTHSVLAKSLMAEPRMTPEQMKRSDIIQNYLMREPTPATSTTNSNGLLVCTPTGPGSRSPAPQHLQHVFAAAASPASSSSSSNSNCASPSTTTVTLASPPPPTATGRWSAHSSVITTTTCQRQQSVSPHSNGSSSSSSSSSSSTSSTSSATSSTATSSTGSSSGCQYFQSPHSTSASVSPPRPSPTQIHTPPRLLELQVDIADSQQPLNLSKKSPTPPPSKLHALVAAANAVQRFPTVSADVTVTATSAPPSSVNTPPNSSAATQQQATTPTVPAVHKVMLEA